MKSIGENAVRADSAAAFAASTVESLRRESAPRTLSPLARAVAAEPVAQAMSPVIIAGVVRIAEFAAILLLGMLLYKLRVDPEASPFQYAVATLGIAASAVVVFQTLNLYTIAAFRVQGQQLARIATAWTAIFLIGFAIAFFAKFETAYSRVWAVSLHICGLAALCVGRSILTALVRRWARAGHLVRRVVIVGSGRSAEALIDALQSEKDSDLRICGVFDDRSEDRSPPVVGGIPKLGTVDDLVEFTRQTRVDLILVSLPMTAEERVLEMVRKLWVLPVDVRLAAHMNQLRFRPRAYSYIGNVPVLDIFDKPIADWNMVIKAVFDRVVGALILLAVFTAMVVIALAVKVDSPGPIFFRQRRYGFNNEPINVLKFRSLYHDMADAAAQKLVTIGDPRVTSVGRIIRKTSLDELPQLFNVVFAGNLSLVGPRPHALNAKAEQRLYEEAVDGYFARHKVKPGITGWAQINGWRGDTDTQEKIQRRIEHDLYYIENWSLMFDIYIVLRTPFALIKAENAY
ncbi:MAG TPA: undecaprenyl-phosphate glucose phosphotransferase [Xanthobacteraceae bacterium]|nr:undecaprenyl-phosphate glucose phosphotransferase [Xanthobacteraceae bacterium]